MSDAKQADRSPSRLALALVARLERYMARAGLIAFLDDPAAAAPGAAAAAPAAGDTSLIGGDPAPAAAAAAAAPAAGAEPTAEEKAAADKAAADKAAADAAKTGAPEKYEDFKLPEGFKADEPVMGEFAALAKDLNLPQEAAQKLVDLAGKMQGNTVAGMQSALETQAAQWASDSKADKEYGGDKFDENLALGKQALDKFGTPELKALLNQSKLGNHPEVLRFFVRAGKAISQDGFAPGRIGAAANGDARQMYAKSNMNP